MGRPSVTSYYMMLTELASSRSTCDRLHVGALIVSSDKRSVLTTGYNGSPSGFPHCDDAGHDMRDNHCVRTVHAEANAIAAAARNGIKIGGGILYVTHTPCLNCMQLVISAGISEIYIKQPYNNKANDSLDFLKQNNQTSAVKIYFLDDNLEPIPYVFI